MRKLALAGLVLAASYFAALPQAAADAAPVAKITITRATNACSAPGAGPAALGYACSYSVGTRDLSLTKNQPATTDLPDGRTFQLVLKDVVENPHRFKVSAASRKAGGNAFLPLADITAKPNETFNFRFPAPGGDALLLEIAIN